MLSTVTKQSGATLDVRTTGIKGVKAPDKKNQSEVTVVSGRHTITLTAVRDRQRLRRTEVEITLDGETVFNGTFNELVDRLTPLK